MLLLLLLLLLVLLLLLLLLLGKIVAVWSRANPNPSALTPPVSPSRGPLASPSRKMDQPQEEVDLPQDLLANHRWVQLAHGKVIVLIQVGLLGHLVHLEVDEDQSWPSSEKVELLQGVLVDAPQVGGSDNSPLTKSSNGFLSSLSSIDKAILPNKSADMLPPGTDENSAMGQPVSVNGASVWTPLDSYDRCRSFPLNRVESVGHWP